MSLGNTISTSLQLFIQSANLAIGTDSQWDDICDFDGISLDPTVETPEECVPATVEELTL